MRLFIHSIVDPVKCHETSRQQRDDNVSDYRPLDFYITLNCMCSHTFGVHKQRHPYVLDLLLVALVVLYLLTAEPEFFDVSETTQTLPAKLAKCEANQRKLAGAKKVPVRPHSGGARLKRAGSRSISRARAGHCDHSSNVQQLMFFRVLRETPWKTSRLRLNESQTRTSRRKDHETTKHEARKRRKMETERTNVSKHMCK